jgi:hypothetical protein
VFRWLWTKGQFSDTYWDEYQRQTAATTVGAALWTQLPFHCSVYVAVAVVAAAWAKQGQQ